MKNNIHKIIAFMLLFVFGMSGRIEAQVTVEIGTASTVNLNSDLISVYPSWFTASRLQYIITAAELQAAGASGSMNIKEIAFNVQAAGTGSTSGCPSGWANGQVDNFVIGLKNTSEGLPLNSTLDLTGITQVYSASTWVPAPGWNSHTFSNNFQWDGVSNLLVDICVSNYGTSCATCYTYNATNYYTATKAVSGRGYWADGSGSFCGSIFPNACGSSPGTLTTSGNRPNMRFLFAPIGPPVPPSPNFQFVLGQDTLWEGAPSQIINTSVNSSKNYWNVTGYNATSGTGPWNTYNQGTLQCNSFGCFIDTLNNDPNFIYYFPVSGFYKVMLTTVNNYGTASIEKVVYVDAPRAKPTALFYATRRQVGANDRVKFNNLSNNAPARIKWWLKNTCTSCPADTNKWLTSDSALSPTLAAYTPGVYDVCLAVSNSKGSDTMCRPAYLTISPGYLLFHSEAGRFDSVGTASEGYLYSDLRTSAGVNLAGQFQPTGTGSLGFRIAPCADTIYLTLERLRMRNPGTVAGDSIYLRLNGFAGPIVRRWGGGNIAALKDSVKTYKFAGQQIFVTYIPAPVVPTASIVNDSGFTLHWSTSPAMYGGPTAGFTCPDTLYSGYKVRFVNSSVGNRVAYAWDLNNDGAFGQDKPSTGIDSVTQNPTITFVTTTPSTRKVCLKTYNCVGVDTFCRVLPIFPITAPPVANFVVNRTTGFISDTFMLIDKSQNGALTWKWRFEPNNVTYLNGTDSTSQFPYISLNSPQAYNITLIVSNQFGSSQITQNQLISAIDYGSPGSAYPPTTDGTDFGISRVVIKRADGTVAIDTMTALKTPTYTRMYSDKVMTVYRGASYMVDVYRNSATDAQSLKAWVDFNRDADYTDTKPVEEVYSEILTKNVKSSFELNIPSAAEIGRTRLLIGACNAISSISSTTANVGVYEDFGLIVAPDFQKPVIVLKGSANDASEIDLQYNDPGVTATDNIEGNISDRVQKISNLDITHLGVYQIKYFVTDLYGNTSDTVVRNIQVVLNNTGPKLNLFGNDTVYVEVFSSAFLDPGYQAFDNKNVDITPQVKISGAVDVSVVGTVVRTYSITDAYGFKVEKQRVIIVRDTKAPEIGTYIGGDKIIHQIGTAFDDAKYVVVTDNYYHDLLPNRTKGTINPNKEGSYLLIYQNTDPSGNQSAEFVLTVDVKNSIPPTITLVGSAVVVVPVYGEYNDLGVIARDYKGDILPYATDLAEKLHMDSIGDYEITYSAMDLTGNSISTKRTIKVRDIESPVIELLGANPYIHELCKSYTDAGVKVSDNYDPLLITKVSTAVDNGLTVTIDSSKLNPCGAGYYYMIYINATDHSGNKAEEKKRVVYVSLTGITEFGKTEGFSMYPNPAINTLNISLQKSEVESMMAIDMQGRSISLLTVKEGANYKVDVSELTAGTYLIHIVTTDGQILNGKFGITK